MGQDKAKSTERVHGEEWSDCTDTQVDDHFFAYYFYRFHVFHNNNNNK